MGWGAANTRMAQRGWREGLQGKLRWAHSREERRYPPDPGHKGVLSLSYLTIEGAAVPGR